MNTAIHNELFKRNTRHLTADGVKAGKDDGFRRIIDDQVNTGCGFKRADIASFTANDAAFHLIVRERNNGNRGFCHMVCSATLNRHGDDIARALIRLFFGFRFDIADHQRSLMARIPLNIAQKDLPCLVHRHPGNRFKLLKLAIVQLLNRSLQRFNLFLFLVQRFFTLFNTVYFFVERFLALGQPALGPLQFISPVAILFFVFALDAVNFFLCL